MIFNYKDVFVCCKKGYKHLIDANYIDSNFDLINCSFAEFILFFEKIHVIKEIRENWAKSRCNCSFFLKNNCSYHMKAVAQNEKLLSNINSSQKCGH